MIAQQRQQLTIFDAPVISDDEMKLPYLRVEDARDIVSLPSQNPAPEPIAPSTSSTKRPIRAPFPAKVTGQFKHLGKPNQPALCGIENARYYLHTHLTQWQFEGLQHRICPDCIEIWRKPATPAVSCPIAPMACVRVWRNVDGQWRDMGITSLVRSLHKVLDESKSLYCFPLTDSGEPIPPPSEVF